MPGLVELQFISIYLYICGCEKFLYICIYMSMCVYQIYVHIHIYIYTCIFICYARVSTDWGALIWRPYMRNYVGSIVAAPDFWKLLHM